MLPNKAIKLGIFSLFILPNLLLLDIERKENTEMQKLSNGMTIEEAQKELDAEIQLLSGMRNTALAFPFDRKVQKEICKVLALVVMPKLEELGLTPPDYEPVLGKAMQ